MPSGICRIPLGRIRLSPNHARSRFDEDAIAALAASIRRCGLLSPLLLRRRGAGEYELIAGARRWLALQRLGCTEADAVILAAYDGDCALLSLIENIQREDLHFLDEARACRRILDRQGLTQEALAALLGRSPSALANRLRLLKLADGVQAAIMDSGLSERHARALLPLRNAEDQLALLRLAAGEKWSVRRLEAQVQQKLKPSPAQLKPPRIRDRRLVVNAFRDTLRRLKQAGVAASSRIEDREDGYDIIISISKNN